MSTASPKAHSINICKNCNHHFKGKYCSECGEKIIDGHERSLMHFVGETFHTITHADGKIFRSLTIMFVNPGFFSKKYSEGIRQPFMKPLSLFFVGTLIYFLFPFFMNTFNTPLYSQMNEQVYSNAIIKPIMEKKLENKSVSYADYEKKYNTKASTLSKLLLVIIIPVVAVLFMLLNFSRKEYFADHMLLATEFMSYLLFGGLILFSLLFYGVVTLGNLLEVNLDFINKNTSTTITISLVLFYFLFRSERTFYKEKIFMATVKSVFFLAGFTAIIVFYRLLLFFANLALL